MADHAGLTGHVTRNFRIQDWSSRGQDSVQVQLDHGSQGRRQYLTNCPAKVLVPDEDYDRAYQLFYAEREDEL